MEDDWFGWIGALVLSPLVIFVIAIVIQVTLVIAFYSMAINISRMRKDVEMIRDVVEINYRESHAARSKSSVVGPGDQSSGTMPKSPEPGA